jgi:hypothetical protein
MLCGSKKFQAGVYQMLLILSVEVYRADVDIMHHSATNVVYGLNTPKRTVVVYLTCIVTGGRYRALAGQMRIWSPFSLRIYKMYIKRIK